MSTEWLFLNRPSCIRSAERLQCTAVNRAELGIFSFAFCISPKPTMLHLNDSGLSFLQFSNCKLRIS